MADGDEIDQKTATIARAKLHAFLGTNPPPDKVKEAHRLLSLLPSPENHTPPEHADAELGIENPINETGNGGLMGKSQRDLDNGAVARNSSPVKPQTELEGDGLTQEILSQAMTMPLLHAIGLGMSIPAKKILSSEGGQAAERIAAAKAAGPRVDFDPEAIVESGSMKGAKAGEALDHLNRLKANGANVERDLENVMDAGMKPSSGIDPADAQTMHIGGPHIGMHGAYLPHASLPAIVGRLTVPAKIAAATGAGIAKPVSSFMMSPLMQAVMTGDDPAQSIPQPALPAGGTK